MRQNLALLFAFFLLMSCLALAGCDGHARLEVGPPNPVPPTAEGRRAAGWIVITGVANTGAGVLHEVHHRGKVYLVLVNRNADLVVTDTIKLDEWPDADAAAAAPTKR